MTDLTEGMAAVIFDFYGTLTPVSPGEAWASNAATLAQVMGVVPGELVRVLDDSFPERISGALGDVRQTMATVAGRLGLTLTPRQLDDAASTRRTVGGIEAPAGNHRQAVAWAGWFGPIRKDRQR